MKTRKLPWKGLSYFEYKSCVTSAPEEEVKKISEYLLQLSEGELRRIIYYAFYESLADGNIQEYHGSGEHGVDLVGVISDRYDAFGKTQVYVIQVKKGFISLSRWKKDVSGQLLDAFCSPVLPMETSEDCLRRIILIVTDGLSPEAFDSVRNWNRRMKIPVEIVNINQLSRIFFEKCSLTLDKIKDMHWRTKSQEPKRESRREKRRSKCL